MTQRDEFQQRAKSIAASVSQLEAAADPALRSAAKDLVQALMDLHGASIQRILEIVHDTGDPGTSLIERFGQDELVRSVLLLYGLHPQDLRTRVVQALDNTRPFLRSHEAIAELVSVNEAGAVAVQFKAKVGGCGSGSSSVKSTIEAAIQEAAPDATSVLVEDVSVEPLAGPTFVSIAALQSGRAMANLSPARAQRSGD
jgi:Fe-S cluster biogenesis protein NfuA